MVIGLERLVVVTFPVWYQANWSSEKNWRVLAVACFCALGSVTGASFVSSYAGPSYKTSMYCPWDTMPPLWVVAYLHIVSVLGGFCAVVTTLISYGISRNRFKKLPKVASVAHDRRRAQKQLQLTKAMLITAFLDFCLVVCPNTCFLLNKLFGIILPLNNTYVLYMYNANASLNMLANFVFNKEFRKAARKLFRLDKIDCAGCWPKGTATVVPSSVAGDPSQKRTAM